MSDRNSDWADSGASSGGDWGEPSGSPSSPRPARGRWHAAQTVTALLVVAALSFLMAYLTRDIQERPVWMMGLIFMVPAAALLFSALGVENATSAMTPNFSRRAQMIVALSATLLTFIVGCLCDTVYLAGFIQHDNVIFALDKSASQTLTASSGNSRDTDNQKALRQILSQMGDGDQAGLVLFSSSVLGKVPVAPLTKAQRADILAGIDSAATGGTYFYPPLDEALKMIEASPELQRRKTKIILLTDGEEFTDSVLKSLAQNTADIISRCKAANAVISCVQTYENMDFSVIHVIDETGGAGVWVSDAAQLTASLGNISLSDQDLLRSDDTSARVISFIMLLLEGLTLGFGLSLMLSVSGQFRFQLILSPLMGVAAFFLLKEMSGVVQPHWVAEGLAFSLLGVVFMRRNNERGAYRPSAQTGGDSPAPSDDLFSSF